MSDPRATPDAAAWELASAHLDGDVDAAARARVDGSPELLAMVAELREVRDALAATPQPPAAARDRAIAAALEAAPTGGRIVAIGAARTRRRLAWIGAVAAGLIAVVAVATFRGGTPPNEFAADQRAPTTASPSATALPGDAATAAGAAPAATFAPAAAAAASASSDGSEGSTSGVAALDTAAGTTPEAALPVLDAPDQLRELPRSFVAAAPAADGPATTTAAAGTPAGTATTAGTTPCVHGSVVLLAYVTYRGRLAVAVVDDRRRVRAALDPDTCAVLAEVADTP